MTDQTAVPCNAAQLHRFGDLQTAHGPHEWIVQPGMDPVRCPGAGDPPAAPAVQAPTAARAALRNRIAEALEQADYRPDMRRGDLADAVLPVLPAPVDRAAVLREAADRAEIVALRLRMKHDIGAANGAYEVMTELRRMADEAQPATARLLPDGTVDYDAPPPPVAEHGAPLRTAASLDRAADEAQPAQHQQPRRGDQFEQWLKARRDEWAPEGCQPWQILDQALEEYRLHANTGTPLDGHVCEGKTVGDREYLEKPAAEARQDGARS